MAGPIAVISAMIALTTVCSAALTWDEKQIEILPKPGDKEAVAFYHFKNTGRTTVTVTGVRASCDCTATELTKRTYAPRETGVIKATFAVVNRTGIHQKQITITTDEPAAKATTLTLKVNIPEILGFSTRMLHWQAGADDEQRIEVSALNGNAITSLEVADISPKQAKVRIEPVHAGLKYRLFVKPIGVDQPRTITITMLARLADNTDHSFLVFALVR